MAAGDRNKNGRPKDFVRHYGNKKNPTGNYLLAICGNKAAGYVTDDMSDVTCLKCLKKINIKQPTMKTEAQPTAKHAEGEWNVFNAFARFEIREKEDDRQNIAEVYDEANAARIVKCVNMHDELVDGIRRALNDFSKSTWTEETYKTLERLLNQASQK